MYNEDAIRALIPKSYHFDGYNEINVRNSRDRPFFIEDTVSIGDYSLTKRISKNNSLILEFASTCPKGKYTFKPYTLSFEKYLSLLECANSENCDFISFPIEINCNYGISCENCEFKSSDCIHIKTGKEKMAAVSFDMSDIKNSLAKYYNIISKGDNTMKKGNKLLGLNFEFGASKDRNIAATLMGVAVKNPDSGNWYTYDKATNTRKNLAGMKIGNLPIFLLPSKDIQPGDLIKKDGKYFYVQEIGANNTLKLYDAITGSINEFVAEEGIIPGLNFYTKVMPLDTTAISSGAFSNNIFAAMLMMQWSKNDGGSEFSLDDFDNSSFNGLGEYLPLLLMQNGTNNPLAGTGLDISSLLLLNSCNENDSATQMLVLSSLLGGKSPLSGIMDGSPLSVGNTNAEFVCEKCGEKYGAGVNFCSKCGGKIIPVAAVVCKKCGKVLQPGDAFCSGCGAKVGPSVCPKCGAEVTDDAAFCSKCGNSLKEDPSETPVSEGEK